MRPPTQGTCIVFACVEPKHTTSLVHLLLLLLLLLLFWCCLVLLGANGANGANWCLPSSSWFLPKAYSGMTDAVMQDEGPIALPTRYFVALMAAGSYRCEYLARDLAIKFLDAGGDRAWLEGCGAYVLAFVVLCDDSHADGRAFICAWWLVGLGCSLVGWFGWFGWLVGWLVG